ncbi:Nuclear cap-binding protein subunit 3 like protein [Argiope bruennichi]|uniref:Nuclear cap-binding protein subunit 3 n=2 Tax=Argiope bruennichi TaxID=94029 RepID=A0A8T0F6I2_ARGBR|nr:Nuclear cap-binding protein subunit 3 like protein [Argiope bruennichi]
MGKLLPNLEITLGLDTDSEIFTEEGELYDSLDEELEDFMENEKDQKQVEVYRTWMQTLQEVKVYENKAGTFVTGVDLASEALIKKLQERAERFGITKKDGPITQKKIDELYKSLGIEPENLNTCKLKNIRLEALHMRGVEEMSTTDIFTYFEDYCPASVEWINDISCNVIWLDAASTARAMIGMSRPLTLKKKGTTKQKVTESVAKGVGQWIGGQRGVKSPEVEYIIEMSDLEEDECSDKKESDETVVKSMEVDSLPDTEKPGKSETKNDSSEVVNVPVPPGYWRIGIRHPKSKAILLRFATRDDKKLPGAEKRSQYYQKYGNPNYGGLKGLISSSRKRKMQAARNRQVVEKLTEDITSQSENNSGETSKRTVIKASRTKMPRMRMYADDEEAKKKKSVPVHYEAERKSVHSRLGTKYTKDDLSQLGNRFSSESEEEDDNISIHCTVPDRYNVWTDIAEEDRRQDIAEEDRRRPRANSPDTESFDQRKSRSHEKKGGRSFARNRSSPESAGGSRPWRPSRDDSSEDLRRALSSRRQSPLNRREEDLRSKIKRIKKDAGNKHRSPMFMDD